MASIEPFTISENPDGSIDVVFQGATHPLSFRSADSFRHVFRKRGLTDGDLDLVLENHRYIRRGLSYCEPHEKAEFRELAQQVRRHPEVRSWPGFRDLLHLHPSVDPRRLVEDGGTKTHLVTLRREASLLLGEQQVQAIRNDIMRARSNGDTPMEPEPEEVVPVEERTAAVHESASSNGASTTKPVRRGENKISNREDLPILSGKQSPRAPTPQGKRESDRLTLYLKERYQLDSADIGRMAGLTAGGAAAVKKGFPPARLDLLKRNIKDIFKIDAEADILHGANDRYHANGKMAGKEERKRDRAGMGPIVPPQAPPTDPTFDQLMDSGREHLRSGFRDFKTAQGKLKGMMALAMDDLLKKITIAIAECDGDASEVVGAEAR